MKIYFILISFIRTSWECEANFISSGVDFCLKLTLQRRIKCQVFWNACEPFCQTKANETNNKNIINEEKRLKLPIRKRKLRCKGNSRSEKKFVWSENICISQFRAKCNGSMTLVVSCECRNRYVFDGKSSGCIDLSKQKWQFHRLWVPTILHWLWTGESPSNEMNLFFCSHWIKQTENPLTQEAKRTFQKLFEHGKRFAKWLVKMCQIGFLLLNGKHGKCVAAINCFRKC